MITANENRKRGLRMQFTLPPVFRARGKRPENPCGQCSTRLGNDLHSPILWPQSCITLSGKAKKRGAILELPDLKAISPSRDATSKTMDLADILVVDDDPDAFMLLSLALETSGGYRATVAESAKEALKAMYESERPFRGIFLDIQMPETTGLELCSIIRSIPGYEDVPVVMVTAIKDSTSMQQAYAAGASDYITKPICVDVVRDRFDRLRENQPERVHSLEGIISRVEAQNSVRTPDEPIPLEGVDKSVSRDAFHAYLLQAKHNLAVPMRVQAVGIRNFLEFFSETPPDDFREAIIRVGRMLSGLTADEGVVLTYFGNGIFVTCAAIGRDTRSSYLESSLNGLGGAAYGSRTQHQLQLVPGTAIEMDPHSNSDVFDVLNRAIDSLKLE
jgi:CheY-like chemotaxis protein